MHLKGPLSKQTTNKQTNIYIYRSRGDRTSLMNILEDYFATTYPIHVRRADLAKLRKSNYMSNSEFADLYIQKCNEAQVLGRSAANTDCGNCIELHKLNAVSYTHLTLPTILLV